MLLEIIIIIIGAGAVVWGADRLTEGAVALAKRMGISQLVIGLTIVALGTSMPELCVSLVSALKGTPDLAIGNVVGSNIINTLLIVGVAALVAPIAISPITIRRDIPFALAASIMLTVCCLDSYLSRIDSTILIIFLVIYAFLTMKGAKKCLPSPPDQSAKTDGNGNKKVMKIWAAALWIVVGLALLAVGSDAFVEGASAIAERLHVPHAVIGLTIVAGGTSLPELATCVVAAKKGNSGIAIGNALGSNVLNILLILGLTGTICPMSLRGIGAIDMMVMTGGMLLLWLFSYSKYTIERWEGAVLSLIYMVYLAFLIIQVSR